MTQEQLAAMLERNPSLAERNSHLLNETNDKRETRPAICEQAVQDRPHGKVQRAPKDTGRYAVRITARRLRVLDPDNLAGGSKYFIDSLRIARLIPDDTPEQITLTVTQERVSDKEHEGTEIQIERIG